MYKVTVDIWERGGRREGGKEGGKCYKTCGMGYMYRWGESEEIHERPRENGRWRGRGSIMMWRV